MTYEDAQFVKDAKQRMKAVSNELLDTLLRKSGITADAKLKAKQIVDQSLDPAFQKLMKEGMTKYAKWSYDEGVKLIDTTLNAPDFAAAVTDRFPRSFADLMLNDYYAEKVTYMTEDWKKFITRTIDLGFIGTLKDYEVRDRLMTAPDVGVHRARRIMITEQHRLANMGSLQRMKNMNQYLDGAVPMLKYWVHSSGMSTAAGAGKRVPGGVERQGFKKQQARIRYEPRPNHKAMHGTKVEVEEKFDLIGINGDIHYLIERPHDDSLPAREVVNCFCTISMKIDRNKVLQAYEEKKDTITEEPKFTKPEEQQQPIKVKKPDLTASEKAFMDFAKKQPEPKPIKVKKQPEPKPIPTPKAAPQVQPTALPPKPLTAEEQLAKQQKHEAERDAEDAAGIKKLQKMKKPLKSIQEYLNELAEAEMKQAELEQRKTQPFKSIDDTIKHEAKIMDHALKTAKLTDQFIKDVGKHKNKMPMTKAEADVAVERAKIQAEQDYYEAKALKLKKLMDEVKQKQAFITGDPKWQYDEKKVAAWTELQDQYKTAVEDATYTVSKKWELSEKKNKIDGDWLSKKSEGAAKNLIPTMDSDELDSARKLNDINAENAKAIYETEKKRNDNVVKMLELQKQQGTQAEQIKTMASNFELGEEIKFMQKEIEANKTLIKQKLLPSKVDTYSDLAEAAGKKVADLNSQANELYTKIFSEKDPHELKKLNAEVKGVQAEYQYWKSKKEDYDKAAQKQIANPPSSMLTPMYQQGTAQPVPLTRYSNLPEKREYVPGVGGKPLALRQPEATKKQGIPSGWEDLREIKKGNFPDPKAGTRFDRQSIWGEYRTARDRIPDQYTFPEYFTEDLQRIRNKVAGHFDENRTHYEKIIDEAMIDSHGIKSFSKMTELGYERRQMLREALMERYPEGHADRMIQFYDSCVTGYTQSARSQGANVIKYVQELMTGNRTTYDESHIDHNEVLHHEWKTKTKKRFADMIQAQNISFDDAMFVMQMNRELENEVFQRLAMGRKITLYRGTREVYGINERGQEVAMNSDALERDVFKADITGNTTQSFSVDYDLAKGFGYHMVRVRVDPDDIVTSMMTTINSSLMRFGEGEFIVNSAVNLDGRVMQGEKFASRLRHQKTKESRTVWEDIEP